MICRRLLTRIDRIITAACGRAIARRQSLDQQSLAWIRRRIAFLYFLVPNMVLMFTVILVGRQVLRLYMWMFRFPPELKERLPLGTFLFDPANLFSHLPVLVAAIALAIAFALLLNTRPALRAAGSCLRRALAEMGRCQECGYALTPGSTHCPECGAAIQHESEHAAHRSLRVSVFARRGIDRTPAHRIITVTNAGHFRSPARLWVWYQLMLFRSRLGRAKPDLSWRYALRRTASWMIYAFLVLLALALLDLHQATMTYAREHFVAYSQGLLTLITLDVWLLPSLALYAIYFIGIAAAIFHFENRRRLRLLRYFGRCTRCGHPRLDDPTTPCIECGNTRPHEPIDHWYHPKHTTAEQRRRGKRMITRQRAKRFGIAEA